MDRWLLSRVAQHSSDDSTVDKLVDAGATVAQPIDTDARPRSDFRGAACATGAYPRPDFWSAADPSGAHPRSAFRSAAHATRTHPRDEGGRNSGLWKNKR